MLKNLRNSRKYKDEEAEKRVQDMKDELLLPPKLTPMRDPAAEAIAESANNTKTKKG